MIAFQALAYAMEPGVFKMPAPDGMAGETVKAQRMSLPLKDLRIVGTHARSIQLGSHQSGNFLGAPPSRIGLR